jgi:hypothetical protein
MAEHKQKSEQKSQERPLPFDPVEAALRQIFDDVASEDIPPDFADLVAKLEQGMCQPEEE